MKPSELIALDVADDPAAWERIGFSVRDGVCPVGTTTIRLTPLVGAEGLVAWTLWGEGEGDVDGLPTRWVREQRSADHMAVDAVHQNGALRLDHVVVMTPDSARTFAALEAIGLDLRRVRDAGTPDKPLRQGFFRAGEVVLEVVGPPAATGDGPASFWGLVAVVPDLDVVAATLGDDLGSIRDAVQPGQRIATVRRSSGVSVPLALITPRGSVGAR